VSGLCYVIVTYHFPPATTAGAVRAYGLARRLGEAGNEVHVFAPACGPAADEPFEVHVVAGAESGDGVKSALGVAPGSSLRSRVPASLAPAAGRALGVAKEWAFFPDTARAWADRCGVALAEWLKDHSCDVVISSSPPVSAHVAVFDALARQPGPVWIADWRDLWTRNPHYSFGSVRAARDRRLEARLLVAADAVTATTAEMGAILAEVYPHTRVVPVYNGYDEHSLGSEPPDRTERPLVITHAGYLYEGKRSVAPLLRIVGELIAEGAIDRDRIRFRFAGPPDATLSTTVEALGLADVVEVLGIVPRTDVAALLEDSDVLLIVTWDAVLERSLVPAKTFEYIAARRPVLALNCSAEGELGTVLARTGAGTCVDGDDQTREALMDLYRRREAGEPLPGAGVGVGGDYTHGRMAAQFDDLARSLVGARAGGDRHG
jgi:glycosyltransferase involved in cell wall biosynthesis